jgi:hypothetical protein
MLDQGSIARNVRSAGDSRRSWIASSARNAGAEGPWRSTSGPRAVSAVNTAVACAISAFRLGGGRVGMNSASTTPASVECNPPAWMHAHNAMPRKAYGSAR